MAERHRRARLPRNVVRTAAAPANKSEFEYVVWLVPARMPSGLTFRQRLRMKNRISPRDHLDLIAQLREQSYRTKINTSKSKREMRTRIYIENDAGVVFLKMMRPQLIWKVYRINDVN